MSKAGSERINDRLRVLTVRMMSAARSHHSKNEVRYGCKGVVRMQSMYSMTLTRNTTAISPRCCSTVAIGFHHPTGCYAVYFEDK